MKNLLLLFLVLFFHGNASSANYTWTGNADSLWSNAANWTGGASYPSSNADNVTINHNTIVKDIVLTENIIVNNIQWNERRSRGLDLNGFNCTVDGNIDLATNSNMVFERSNGQLILNGDLNLGTGSTAMLFNVLQTTGDINISTGADMNFVNPSTRIAITLNRIKMSDKSFLFFKNNRAVTLSDIDVGEFCVVEFPRGQTTTFTSVVDWNQTDCASFNTFRSYIPGTRATLKFTGGASSGDFNAYEDIRILTTGGGNTFTADNRTNLGNNTGISGTTLGALTCSFDGNGDNSGNWSDAAEWSCGCVPRSIDNVIIEANKTVTIDDVFAQSDDLEFIAATSRIVGSNTNILEIHGDLITIDESNFEDLTGTTEFRNDVVGDIETLTCSSCDTVKFYGPVLFEFPGNVWEMEDHLKIVDLNDNRRGDIRVERGTLDLKDFDLSFESDFDINDELITGVGTVRVIDQANSTMRVDGTADLHNLVIDKSLSSELVTLITNILVTNELDLTGLGIITIPNTGQDTLILSDNATVLGGSNNCHVNPSMLKIGNDDFTFPVGNGTFFRPIGITDMVLNSTTVDQIYGEYILVNPFDTNMVWNAWSSPITNVSTREYWELKDVAGSPTPQIVLSWLDPSPSGGVGDINDLLVTHWNGTSFDNLGNGSITGNTTNGTITSEDNVTSFSPFVLGSSSSSNTLPIELISFGATINENVVIVDWSTLTEINNDIFIVERSLEGQEFGEVGRVDGAGNSQKRLDYKLIDYDAPQGELYYRLRQIDFDGTQVATYPVFVRNIKTPSNTYKVYPNPLVNGQVLVVQGEEYLQEILIYDLRGKMVFRETLVSDSNQIHRLILPTLKAGVYYVEFIGNNQVVKLIINN